MSERSGWAALEVIWPMATITAGTIADAARGTLTIEATNRRLTWWGAETLRRTGIELRLRGTGHLAGGPFLVMSNHLSHFDVPLLFAGVGGNLRMVTKTELFRIPVWGPAMRKSGFIEIDRKNRERARQSLERAKDTLRGGVNVWIAPEGTRSRDGELQAFKKGGFILASEMGVPILPVAIAGTHEILPPTTLKALSGGTVAIVIGAPIASEGRDKETLLAETRAAIAGLCAEARALRAGQPPSSSE
ncbi:MAG: 1-acyl-sn-glycerol-3-phosphate acyltransferase [Polyangiaceae bacterium]|nr:1-acyl-sn-glycerol-3-phosphate acyltransferase [Polyangiaceae bacterium]